MYVSGASRWILQSWVLQHINYKQSFHIHPTNMSLLESISHWFTRRITLKELHVTICSKTHGLIITFCPYVSMIIMSCDKCVYHLYDLPVDCRCK